MALSSFLGAVSQPPTGHRACPHQLSAGLVPPNEPEDEDIRPITVGEMFLNTVKLFPDKRALRYKESDQSDWTDINYAEYYKYSIAAAKSFVKLGVEPSSTVALMGLLSPESVISYFGSVFAGGIFMGLRVDGTPEGNTHTLNLCQACVVLVESDEQVQSILQIRDNLTHMKAIVQYRGNMSKKSYGLYSWTDFMELGEAVEDSVIQERLDQQSPFSCVSMVSTSGTTGHYKIAMLSHDNLVRSARMLHKALSPRIGFGVDRFVTRNKSYYISCFNLDIFLAVYGAACLHFTPPSLADMRKYLSVVRDVQPTLFFGPPSEWETVKSVLDEKGINTVESAKVFLGLQDCRVFLTAGASFSEELREYFERLDMPIMEAYGLTENSGGITINLQRTKPGSVGKPYPGVRVRIKDPDHNGSGEVLVYGRQRFMGYLHDEDETVKAIDEKGWLHTGDIGHVDADGYLYITGRIKEMIVLSNGNNIAPVPIESRLKRELPFLSNVMVVGDGQRYLCCLITLKTLSDSRTGEPLDVLTPAARAQISQLGSQLTTASEIIRLKDESVYGAIQQGIDKVNKIAHFDQDCVRNFTIIQPDFSTFGGEIGETLKLRRYVVKEKYHHQIIKMYATPYCKS